MMGTLMLILAFGFACVNIVHGRPSFAAVRDADGFSGDYHKDDETTPTPPTEQEVVDFEALLARHEELINKLLSAFQSGKVGIESLGVRLQRVEGIIQVALKVIESLEDDEGENGINPLSQLLRGVLEEVKEKYPRLDLEKIFNFLGAMKIEKRSAMRKLKRFRHAV